MSLKNYTVTNEKIDDKLDVVKIVKHDAENPAKIVHFIE
jgi:hypothetical protein